MPISDEKKAELDAIADERTPTLGGVHVTDGKQFYHAGEAAKADHVPGGGVAPTLAEQYAMDASASSDAPLTAEPDPIEPVSADDSLPPTEPESAPPSAPESEATNG